MLTAILWALALAGVVAIGYGLVWLREALRKGWWR